MKNKYIFPCLMVLALASSCIKVEGDEPYTITRKVNTVVEKARNEAPFTIQTSTGAYMYGDAVADSLVEKGFTHSLDNENRLILDCYVTLSSKFMNLNLDRNAVKKAGYVYSREDKYPVVSPLDGNFFWVTAKNGKPVDMDSTQSDFEFEATGHKLDFDVTYFMRSFVISTKGDTLYNPRSLEVKTVLPHDVWFMRNNADLTKRTETFVCQAGDKTYMYGGRTGNTMFCDLYEYDNAKDTWRQLRDAEGETKAKRCNGASFAFKKNNGDYLIYIIGGRLPNDKLTSTVMFYDVKTNTWNQKNCHPNAGQQLPQYDQNWKPIYETDKDGNYTTDPPTQLMADGSRDHVYNLPLGENSLVETDNIGVEGLVSFVLKDLNLGYERYFVAFGKNSRGQILETVYEYIPHNDRLGSNGLAWESRTLGDNRTIFGLYQPVCVACGDRVMIGTGESSKLKDHNVSSKFYFVELDANESDRLSLIELKNQPPSEFKARANAAGFYLSYEAEHEAHECFYVGTGRTVRDEDFTGFELLNDFWCYDFSTTEWTRKANTSNVCRQGSKGFTVLRNDDDYEKQGGSKLRGFISFGEGFTDKDGDGIPDEKATTQLDNWEYLP